MRRQKQLIINVDIILKWRRWQYVVSADFEKMNLQINIAESDQEFVHVSWRDSPKNIIKDYKLTTSAPKIH